MKDSSDTGRGGGFNLCKAMVGWAAVASTLMAGGGLAATIMATTLSADAEAAPQPRPGLPSQALKLQAGRTASSVAELLSLLKTAKGGDVIRLAPGSYDRPVIVRLHFDQPVTIVSEQPDRPARIVGLGVVDSSGLNFRGLDLTTVGSSDKYYAFRVADSDHISFSNLHVHGDLAGEPADQLTAFYIATSAHVSIVDCAFDHLNAAIIANRNTDVDIRRNSFTVLNKSGIGVGGAVRINIMDNLFTDFHVSRGTHPDAIQFYTAGVKTPSEDILIAGNLYLRGRGDAAQGIFLGDESGAGYHKVTIVDNAMIGAMWDAIYVHHPVGPLVVKDNVAASWPGLDQPGVGTAEAAKTPATVSDFIAFLYIGGDTGDAQIVQTGNSAQSYKGLAEKTGIPKGNKLLGPVKDGGKALVDGWIRRRARSVAVDCEGKGGCVLVSP